MHQKNRRGTVGSREVRRCENPNCGKLFIPRNINQRFCPGHYIKRVKKESKYPMWVCPSCGIKTDLGFFPCFAAKRWREFCCPSCGHAVDNDNDYEEIEEIKKLFRLEGVEE